MEMPGQAGHDVHLVRPGMTFDGSSRYYNAARIRIWAETTRRNIVKG